METNSITAGPLEIVAPSALEAMERANIDIQISTAKKFPRGSLAVIRQRMLDLATIDEETAASCFYNIARGGKSIEGPSARLAEIAVSCFGNIRYGSRLVGNNGKTVTAQGFCHDLETNVLYTSEVDRRITDKHGRTFSEDMQVVTGSAAGSIASRNATFKVVPMALIKPVYEACKRVAVGDVKTLTQRRTKMLAAFAAFGINEDRICQAVGVKTVEEIGLKQLETLIGLHNAIKDGEQNIDEAFPPITKIQFGAGPVPTQAAPTTATKDVEPLPVEKTAKTRSKKKEPAPAIERVFEPVPPPSPLEKLERLIASMNFTPQEYNKQLRARGVIEESESVQLFDDDKLNELLATFEMDAKQILLRRKVEAEEKKEEEVML